MTNFLKGLVAAALAGGFAFGANAEPVRNVVIVHGAFADGSAWRGIYAIAPDLLRSTARRIGAETTEVPGSHVVFLTQPKAVADVIDAAAKGAVGVGE